MAQNDQDSLDAIDQKIAQLEKTLQRAGQGDEGEHDVYPQGDDEVSPDNRHANIDWRRPGGVDRSDPAEQEIYEYKDGEEEGEREQLGEEEGEENGRAKESGQLDGLAPKYAARGSHTVT